MNFSKVYLMALVVVLSGCSPSHSPYGKPEAPPGDLGGDVKFAAVQSQVLSKCIGCHNSGSVPFDLTSLDAVMNRSGFVVPGSPETSRFFTVLQGGTMPPSGPLSSALQALVFEWIQQGANL